MSKVTGRRRFGIILVLGGIAILAMAALSSVDDAGTLYFADVPFSVTHGAMKVTLITPASSGADHAPTSTQELPIAYDVDGNGRVTRETVRIPVTGHIVVHRLTGQTIRLTFVKKSAAPLAAAGVLCLALGLPYALFDSRLKTSESQTHIGSWYYLLSESSGGLSLAKVQLLLWFLPAACIYAAISIPLHTFPPMDTTLAVLLSLTGATTLLSAASSPKDNQGAAKAQPAAAPAVAAPAPSAVAGTTPAAPASVATPGVPAGGMPSTIPDLSARQLVTDWQGNGDMSRYQYLLLTLLGVTIFTISFLKEFRIPTIPQQFLYLIAASQATYLGTKAVKETK